MKLIAHVWPASNPAGYSEKSASHSDWSGLNWTFIDQQYNGTQDPVQALPSTYTRQSLPATIFG
jgi:hypothetical protein